MFVKSLEGGVKSEVGMKTPEVGENIEKNVPTSGEFKNSDVDNYEKQDESYEQKLNGNQFVDRVLYSNFEDVALSPEDKRQLDILLPKIRENLNNYTELDPKNELYQKYQKMISDGEYEDVNELCNGEGLNEDDVYDNEPKIYCEEYSSGLADGYDDKDFYVDGDYTEAYVKGYNDGKESSSLIKNPGIRQMWRRQMLRLNRSRSCFLRKTARGMAKKAIRHGHLIRITYPRRRARVLKQTRTAILTKLL